ncbi:MAG: YdeI/OmpD-associated family protein [Chitinophagales bacterium]|nr:YdeI/OmpD-associated family protein [Chitinophagales bacterium]MDW8428328.1 YdeI/OmpD-associated family protein [Chitinophagales bacterium]
MWLVLYHKSSNKRCISFTEAVEEAICFGWIDSVSHKGTSESRYLYFTHRNPKSKWNSANRERAERMTAQGMMMPAGKRLVDPARKTSLWEALDEVQQLVIPADLQALLEQNQAALRNFTAFPPSS